MAKKPKPVVNEDGLDIPEFLRRQSDGKPNRKAKPPTIGKGKARAVVAPPKPPTPLEKIEDPALRAYVEGEIKANRVQERWLEDPSTLMLLKVELDSKTKRKEEGLAKLRALGEERRKERAAQPPKPAFGATVYFSLVTRPNPRQKGTNAGGRYDEMLTYLAKNREATVADVLTNTGYRKADLDWDIAKGYIKTDIHKPVDAKAIVARNIEKIEKEADAKVAAAKKKAEPKVDRELRKRIERDLAEDFKVGREIKRLEAKKKKGGKR